LTTRQPRRRIGRGRQICPGRARCLPAGSSCAIFKL
jgi:hypothetical protein